MASFVEVHFDWLCRKRKSLVPIDSQLMIVYVYHKYVIDRFYRSIYLPISILSQGEQLSL